MTRARLIAGAALVLAACAEGDPPSPIDWSIAGSTVACPGADAQLVLPASGPPAEQVCVWRCVTFEGQERREVEAWFDSADGGATWSFRRTYSNPANPANCQ